MPFTSKIDVRLSIDNKPLNWVDTILPSGTSSDFPSMNESHEDKQPMISTEMSDTSTIGNLICVVCNAPAHGFNFDQITCESCKAFFRRNALKELSNFKCRYSGHCVINPLTRRLCSYCRLKKCFDKKMRKDWIRTDEEKQVRALVRFSKQQTKSNPQSKALVSIRDFKLVQRRKKRLMPLKVSLVKHFHNFGIHRDLTADDRIRLNNIINAYSVAREMADYSHITRYNENSTVIDFINGESRTFKAMVEFLKSVPQFHKLRLADQILLVKRNLCVLNQYHHILLSEFHENPLYIHFMSRWISPTFSRNMVANRARSNCFMNFPTVLKLALVVFVFGVNLSAPRSIDDDLFYCDLEKIRSFQDYFLDMLWKYLSYILKDENETRRAMLTIVMQILRYQTLLTEFEDHIWANGRPPVTDPLMESILRLT